MIYESLSDQYSSITRPTKTNSSLVPNDYQNLNSANTSPDTSNKKTYTPKANDSHSHSKCSFNSNTIHQDYYTQYDQSRVTAMTLHYDQTSERNQRRNSQMRRLQSKKQVEELKLDEGSSSHSKNESCNFFNRTGLYKTNNDCHHMQINERVFKTESQVERNPPVRFIIEDSNINESDTLAPSSSCNDAEINISDLDCNLNGNEDNESGKSISICSNTSRSFVSLTNNLMIKKDAKEDNLTSSYLLALNPNAYAFGEGSGSYCGNEMMVKKNDDDEDENYDNGGVGYKDIKHVRLPSGKNFLISSVIEEEKSDIFTDSEISNKKLSFLLSTKQRLERALGKSDSDFKKSGNIVEISTNSKDFIKSSVDKNLDKLFFLNIQKKGGYTSNSNHRGNDVSDQIEQENLTPIIQVNLKRTYEEIIRDYNTREEVRKSKIESKKKAVLDLFLTMSKVNANSTNNNNQKSQNLSTISECNVKLDEYIQSLENNKDNHNPSHNESIDDNNKINLDISSDSEQKLYNNNHRKENSGNNAKKKEMKTHEEIHQRYKETRHKKKSSIFKSEDLIISKTEDVCLDTSKLVSPMSNEKINNILFSSEKTSANKYDIQQEGSYEIEKLNDIRQKLFTKTNNNNDDNITIQKPSVNIIKRNHPLNNEVSNSLRISNEISFNVQSLLPLKQELQLLPPQHLNQRARNISMQITNNTRLEFEGISHKPFNHTKTNSHIPSLKLSQTLKLKPNPIDNPSVEKMLSGFSSMLSKLKTQNRFSLSLGKNRPNSSSKDKKTPQVNYARFNSSSSSHDKNNFNKQLSSLKDTNKSTPVLLRTIQPTVKTSNVVLVETQRIPNKLPPKKLLKTSIGQGICVKRSTEEIREYGNRRSISNSLNVLLYYREGEKREAMKSVEYSKASYFALYLREENCNHYFMGVYEIWHDKECLHKITSGNRYPIPINISYSNLIACFTIDDSMQFETRIRIIIGKDAVGFFPNCLKF